MCIIPAYNFIQLHTQLSSFAMNFPLGVHREPPKVNRKPAVEF